MSEAGIASLARGMLAAALLLLGLSCLDLDPFMFTPWAVDEYLRPADIDSTAWRVRGIIPETLCHEVQLTSSGANRIYGILVQPKGGACHDGTTILYCHGKTHNINRYWGRVELLWEMGYRVFIFDYQGYGKSEGAPSGEACYADGRAALAFLRSRPEVDSDRIIYYGWSLGTFVATYLAADWQSPFGLILESPIASAQALIKEGTVFDIPSSMLTRLDFDNESRIPRVRVPVLMMHGTDDNNVPPARHVERLLTLAEGHTHVDMVWAEGAAHEDVPYVLGADYAACVNSCIDSLVNKRHRAQHTGQNTDAARPGQVEDRMPILIAYDAEDNRFRPTPHAGWPATAQGHTGIDMVLTKGVGREGEPACRTYTTTPLSSQPSIGE